MDVAPIHHVEGARLEDESVQDVDIVRFAVRDADETWESSRAGPSACAA